MQDSNVGKWDGWYAGATEPRLYGDVASYEVAAEWLADCVTVADWGCGLGGFRRFVQPPRQYFGFDGSRSRFTDRVVDLTDFRFETEGVLLRHVIEHNVRWADVLANAAASYQKKMVVVLFTPIIDSAEPLVEQIAFAGPGGGVPDLSFSLAAIDEFVPRAELAEAVFLESGTQYGSETVLCYRRET